MSKTTLSIFTSILLGSAIALPAAASARPTAPPAHQLPHFRSASVGLMGRFSEPTPAGSHKAAVKAGWHRPALLDPNYTIIDEPDADPSVYGTRVFGINESGQISGQYVDSGGAFHAFLGTPNGNKFKYTPITVNGGDTFSGFLNDKGEIFGSYVDGTTGIENTWIRNPDGKIETVQPPDGTNGSFGEWLNDRGVLVGNYLDDNGAIHTFVRTKNGVVTQLADAPNSGADEKQGTQGITINAAGVISGQVTDSNNVVHGFVRSPTGTYAQIDVPGAGSGEGQGTTVVESDDKGCMSGQYIDSGGVFHGFILCGDAFTSVDAPDAGTSPTQGTFVEHREAGWSVGEYIDANDVYHGYFRKKNGKIVEFDAPGAGDLGTYTVYSSNRDHQIAGTFKDDSGIRHGFIRNPH
jgi:hypothetical protein